MYGAFGVPCGPGAYGGAVPPLPRQTVPALLALEEQLRFAPREALLRHLGRAEGLCAGIDPRVEYPEGWIVRTITGFRSESGGEGVVSGADLLRGLPVIVERLSATADLRATDVPNAVRAGDLMARWNISRATLGRWRRRGLCGRRVLDAANRVEMVFMPAAIEAFERANPGMVRQASGFSRLSRVERARILRGVERYRRCLGWSAQRAAARAAGRSGRAVETIRQMVRAAEAAAGAPRAASIDRRQGEVLYRAWRLGVDLGRMCRRTRRSRASVWRSINVARAGRLLAWRDDGALSTPAIASLGTPTECFKALAAAPARSGLVHPRVRTLGEFLVGARDKTPSIAVEERARLLAYHALRVLARERIAGISLLHPRAGEIDQVETWLRWAARLKVALLWSHLRVITDAGEARLGRPVTQVPRSVLAPMLRVVMGAAADAVDSADPTRGGRLAGPIGLACDRAASRWAGPAAGDPRRATSVLPPATPIEDWTARVTPWQHLLDPDPRVETWLVAAPKEDPDAAFLRARFGLDGTPPGTLAEIGKAQGIARNMLPDRERRAMMAARRGAHAP